MEYISKIDNKSFTTKEGLIDHLLEHYSLEAEESDFKDIIGRIQKELPLVKVESVKKDSKNVLVDITYYNMKGHRLDGERIIIGKVEDYDYYGEMICDNLDEVIESLTSFYQKVGEVEKMLIEEFSANTFTMNDIHTGGHDSNRTIYFDYEIDDTVYESRYDFGDTLNQLYNQINSRFVKEIEGRIENHWDSSQNCEVFRIDGVDIKEFLIEGKPALIRILD